MLLCLVLGLAASVQGLVVGTPAAGVARATAAKMGPDDSERLGAWTKNAPWLKNLAAPKGAFGGTGSAEDGWLGDQGQSAQVKKFEAGTDYLFFQGPAPKTAIQEDLPSLFSADNFADIQITPAQIAVTLVGPACFLYVASIVITG
eukprot:5339100-Prymnesium_polylepis.1